MLHPAARTASVRARASEYAMTDAVFPVAFEVSWAELELFDPASQPPPAGVSVVEVPWPAGQDAQASRPGLNTSMPRTWAEPLAGTGPLRLRELHAYAWTIAHHGFRKHPPICDN